MGVVGRDGLLGSGCADTVAVCRRQRCAAGRGHLGKKYAADFEQLAKWCEANGLADEARKTRHVLGPSDPYKLYLPVLPDEVGPPKLPADAPEKVVEWDTRLRSCGAIMPRPCMTSRDGPCGPARPALAFELAMAAVQANPDFEPVRRLLGYQKFRDQWRTLLRGEEAARRTGLERQVRLAAEGPSAAAMRTGSDSTTATGSRPPRMPSGIATSTPAGTWRPSTTRFARTTASRPAWRWA